MRRSLRAALRLLRGVSHGLHGVFVVCFGFGSLDLAAKQARVQWWSAKMLRSLGVRLVVEGEPATGQGLIVANHVSWLDIMAVHAVVPRARFVSKADVKGWPLVSRLVDAAGTLYLERERKRDALRVIHVMADALKAGDTIAVFPEGTTSTGHGLLPFHANLLQAAISTTARIQPVALRYADATHPVSVAVEFVGDTSIAQSLWNTVRGENVVVRLVFLPLREAANHERRELASLLRADIARALGISLDVPLEIPFAAQPDEA